MRIGPVLFSALCGLALLAPGPVLAAPHHSSHHAAGPRHAATAQKPAFSQTVLEAEVLLDRAGASPGAIDGREGENFANALHAFQQASGLPIGPLDQQTMARLAQTSNGPDLTQYTIQPEDVKGPFAPQIPQNFEKMAELPRLAYHNARQELAEKFHMSESLLAALNPNPNTNFDQPGTVITVANVAPMPDDPKLAARSGDGSGSSAENTPAAGKIVVDKPHHAVLVYSPDNRLIAFFPASIGSAEKPAPSGSFVVRPVSYDPTYTYDPAYHFKGQKAERKVTVKPGPNNPVGLVWIGLSAKGYGIHGTPDPEAVGKTQSHGCIRLTNWDALKLAKMVKRGTPVDFVG
jgi:lipoprotein-anchoring transpeptidase ErfK/SrfK